MFVSETESDPDEDKDAQVQQAVDSIMQATARVRLQVKREDVMIFPVESQPVLDATLGEFVARQSTSTLMSLLPLSVSTRGAMDDLRAMVRLPCHVLSVT